MNLSLKKKRAKPVALYSKRKPWHPGRVRGLHKRLRTTRWEKFREHIWPSMGVRAWFRWVWLGMLRQADDPRYVAMGFACGAFVSPLPILGPHMPITFVLCWLFRGSFLASIPGMWIANPWTFALLWPLDFKIGAWLLGLPPRAHERLRLHEINLSEVWQHLEHIGKTVILPSVAGSLVVGLILAFAGYWLVYVNVAAWKARRKASMDAGRARFEKAHHL